MASQVGRRRCARMRHHSDISDKLRVRVPGGEQGCVSAKLLFTSCSHAAAAPAYAVDEVGGGFRPVRVVEGEARFE